MLFYALFKIYEDGDGYPEYYLIGIFNLCAIAQMCTNNKRYTVETREELELRTPSPFRDDMPYDYIIEPMTVNQLTKDADQIATLKYPSW